MIEFQRLLMADRVRNDAFKKALKAVLKPGMTVADIGSGTGFLSFIASKLGAKECHLYEVSPELLALSRLLAKENKISNCRFIEGFSTELSKPVKADVVVSETLGNYALEEGMLETMNDAAKRFLKPGGTMIPRRLRQFVVPIVSDRFWKELNIWPQIGFALSFNAAEQKTLQNVYVREIAESDLLPGKDAVKEWDTIDFTKQNESVREAQVSWTVAKPVTVSGFCLFWESELAPGVTLSTSPSAPSTHWQQIYLPVLQPLNVDSGETLHLALRSDTRPAVKVNLDWKVSVADAKGSRGQKQELDMRRG